MVDWAKLGLETTKYYKTMKVSSIAYLRIGEKLPKFTEEESKS